MIKCCYSTQHEGQGLNGVIGDSGGGQKYHETITLSLLEKFFVLCEYPLQTVWTKQYDFLIVFLKYFFIKSADNNKSMNKNYPACKELIILKLRK